MLTKLAILLSVLSLSFIPINGLAIEFRWPQAGDVYTYHVWDTDGLDRLETEVIREVLIGSEVWYTGSDPGTPFDESTFFRIMGNTVCFWEEGIYMEWALGPSTPTQSMTVPYGGPYQAYPLYYSFSPTHFQYNYLVPEIGIVGFEEYWKPQNPEGYPPGYEFWYYGELVAATLQPVPEPATMILLGSGLIGLAGYGRKKFFKK
jgi:hypothetical protein